MNENQKNFEKENKDILYNDGDDYYDARDMDSQSGIKVPSPLLKHKKSQPNQQTKENTSIEGSFLSTN